MKLRYYLCLIVLLSSFSLVSASEGVTGYSARDPYPLHSVLNYKFDYNSELESYYDLMVRVIKELDIENNPRYFRVGVYYKEGNAYEIPLQEVKDFQIKTSHNNTYCNIFVNDVMNILANSTGNENLRLLKRAVNANSFRNFFENSKNWEEVNVEEAIQNSKNGGISILSYVNEPHGHVAFVRADCTSNDIRLWNVGLVNEEYHKWYPRNNTKYFKWVGNL